MKTILFFVLFLITISQNVNSQIFVSDSIQRFSNSKNEIIERLPDTTYTIERSFKTITVTRRVEGIVGVNYKGVDTKGVSETRWTIQIEEKTLAIRKGNTKSQTIKGIRLGSGYRQITRVLYDLVDRNNDGYYESLEYAMREGEDIELYIFCHLK